MVQSRSLCLVAALCFVCQSLQGCGTEGDSTGSTSSTSTSTSSSTTSTSSTSTTPSPPLTPSDLEAACPAAVAACKKETAVCDQAWVCMESKMHTCQDGGDCLQEVAKVGVTPALESLGDCLSHACESSTTSSTSASTTTTATKHSSQPMTEQEMEKSCPGFVDNTCKEDKVCKEIWLCMSLSMKTCSDGSECIQRTISIMPPTPAAEEIGACLGKACTAGSSTSTSTPAATTTKGSRPIHSADVSAACPGFIDQTCSPDSTCADAWKCMGSMQTCQQGSQCLEQEAKTGTTPALEELASCLDKACTSAEPGRTQVVI
ncbi:unnamed protein product [Symbiodinium natans]|uniref:Uncharacterized protein n=1 Tax=Symbiodinium natans TaxID=878477 RepID=A0A812PK59_9DINO|nr:unnamed protein product [Symbiodinium natans]